jgi:hypothetical protein
LKVLWMNVWMNEWMNEWMSDEGDGDEDDDGLNVKCSPWAHIWTLDS